MRDFLKNILKPQKGMKKILILSICLIVFALIYIYNSNFYVTVRFKELGPVSKNMIAYYNGFKIGKIVKVEPDRDFKNILVKVNLNLKNLELPQNTTVHVKNFPSGELYLQFIYPPAPAIQSLKRGDVLEGVSPYQLEEFMIGQNISGVTDIVSVHVIKALEAMEVANMEMKMFFETTSFLMQKNQEEINQSMENTVSITKSLAQAAENLNQATKKINNAIDSDTLKTTTLNIKDSTINIKELTDNIKKATKDMDKTMKKVDSTVAHTNATAKNLNCITTGLSKTLSKRFAGMRMMFGKPIKD